MSIRLMAEVWRTNLPTVEKMVLLVIADHANDEGTQAWPAQVTIAKKASISVRTVQRAIRSLSEQGYVAVDKHSGGSAECRDDRRPNLYKINLDKLRGDNLTGRSSVAHGATLTTSTGRHSRPLNNPLEPSIETPDPFDDFWIIYPIRVGKQAAKKAWAKAIRGATAEEIMEGARRYRDDPNRHPSFTAHPATWLNAHRWKDDPLPKRATNAQEEAARIRDEQRQKAEKEKEDSARFFAEAAKRKENAVPMPEEIKKLFKKV